MNRLAVLVVALCALLVPATANAELGTAEPLSGPDEYSANETQAAMTYAGQATVFWRGIAESPPVTGIVARSRAVTGGWSAAEVVSDGMPVTQYSSDVAENSGAAVVAWVGTDRDIWAAFRSNAGVWSAPEAVRAAPGVPGVSPTVRVAINRFGQAVVAWRAEDPSAAGQSAFARYRSADGTWGSTENISGLVNTGGDGLDVIADGLGGFAAIWHRNNGDYRVGVATRAAGDVATWASPINPVATESDFTGMPVVGSDHLGNLILVWRQRVAAPPIECPGCFYNQLWAVTRPVGGGWSGPQVVSADDIGVNPSEQPQVAFDDVGNATVAWFNTDGANDEVRSNVRSAAGVWAGPQDVHVGTDTQWKLALAVDGQGAATALWREDAPPSTERIQLSTRSVGGTWTPAATQALTTSNLYASDFPAVAAAGNGGAVAAWNSQTSLDTPPTETFARFSIALAPPVVPPAPVLTTPAIGTVRILPKKIYRRARTRGTKKKRKTAAKVMFSLSEPADVTFTLAFRISGRQVGGKCVRASKRNIRRRACELVVPWGKPIAAGRQSGAASVPFTSKGLRNGNYYLTVNAVSPTGQAAVPKRAKLTIG